jgi:glutaredoxin
VTVGAAPRVELLTRPGCHLCSQAREVLRRVADELGVTWVERDITASPEDLRRYAEWIPVTLIDGVEHDCWRLSDDRLRAALRAGRAG